MKKNRRASSVRSGAMVMAVVFTVLGAAGSAVAAFETARTRSFVSRARHAEGTVVENVPVYSSSRRGHSMTYSPRVRFEGPDGPVEIVSRTSSNPPAFDVGEQVVVLYEDGAPDRARVDSFAELYLFPLISAAVGLPFLAIGVGILAFLAIRRRRRARARLLGTQVHAEVVSIEYRTRVKYNRRSPWVLTAACEDGRGRKLSFESPYLWEDPSPRHPVGSQVRVYYVPADPRTYDIDLEEAG